MAAALAVGSAPAQLLNELLRGAVNDQPTDLFVCDTGTVPCGLSYRYYSEVDASEINGPANPVDGIPRYAKGGFRYIADTQTTANFPVSQGAGGGNEWYLVWDGVTDKSTNGHVGWFGGQSQVVNFGEIGNSLSFNCLPVTSLEACYLALDESNGFSDSSRDDAAPVGHVGGISPIPCPRLTDNALNSVDLAWDQASNSTQADFASDPVVGYDVYALGDPGLCNADASDDDHAAGGVLVGSFNIGDGDTSLDRATELKVPGLLRDTVYISAIKMRYAGGLSSQYFSCNSRATGLVLAEEAGDANSVIDVEHFTTEVRNETLPGPVVNPTLWFHQQLTSAAILQSLTIYELSFDGNNDNVADLKVLALVKFHPNRPVILVTLVNTFYFHEGGYGDDDDDDDGWGWSKPKYVKRKNLLTASVVVDSANGIISFAFNPDELATAIAAASGTQSTVPVAVTAGASGKVTKNFFITDSFGHCSDTFIGTAQAKPVDDDSDHDDDDGGHHNDDDDGHGHH
jgi:hypothetical protein